MTGGELIVKQGNTAVLYKVRHDGYALEEHFKDNKQAFVGDLDKVLNGFITFFDSNYKGDPDDEIETKFSAGYRTTFNKLNLNNTADFFKLLNQMENEIESIDDEDGFLCGYGDFTVFVDLDSNRLMGFMNDEDEYTIINENYEVVGIEEQ